ncbi:MAG: hydrogenase maturation nickel metallochaperone HypA [Anaerovoracaceae bacterium]
MHELGIVFEIVKRVETISSQYELTPEDVAIVVLEVGEASSIVPKYLSECWPAAIDGTPFEEVTLQIEEIIATVKCKACGQIYEYLNNDKKCPHCQDEGCVMVTGQEFNIKEILLYEEEEDEE